MYSIFGGQELFHRQRDKCQASEISKFFLAGCLFYHSDKKYFHLLLIVITVIFHWLVVNLSWVNFDNVLFTST